MPRTLIFAVLVLQGCTYLHSVDVGDISSFEITLAGSSVIVLPPESQQHQELTNWIVRNRDGWDHYVVTLPAPDIMISANNFGLYVAGDAIFLGQRDATMLVRKLSSDERRFFDELVQARTNTSVVLHSVDQVDMASVVCGCTFGAMFEESSTELATDSPTLIVLDVSGEPPVAYANFGFGDIVFRPQQEIRFPLFECEAEEPFKTMWETDEYELTVDVDVSKAGSEACWFYGLATINNGDLLAAKPITGACGC